MSAAAGGPAAEAPALAPGTLFARLRADCAEEWRAYTHHAFVAALGRGTLELAAFRSYLVQDYLYLIQYARAYALAVYKDPDVAGMRRTARRSRWSCSPTRASCWIAASAATSST